MTALFLLAVVAFSVAPDPARPSAEELRGPVLTVEPPQHSPCVACGLGQRCDEATGECRFVEETPLPCEPGSHYDADEGFCIPDPTPEPTPVPSRTLAPGAPPRSTPEPTPPPEVTAEPTPEPTAPAEG